MTFGDYRPPANPAMCRPAWMPEFFLDSVCKYRMPNASCRSVRLPSRKTRELADGIQNGCRVLPIIALVSSAMGAAFDAKSTSLVSLWHAIFGAFDYIMPNMVLIDR